MLKHAVGEMGGQKPRRFWDKKEKLKNGTIPNQPLAEPILGQSSEKTIETLPLPNLCSSFYPWLMIQSLISPSSAFSAVEVAESNRSAFGNRTFAALPRPSTRPRVLPMS